MRTSHHMHVQAGFRKGYSTTEQIFRVKCLIDSVLNSRKKVLCAFILCIYLIFPRPLTWYGEQDFGENSLTWYAR